MKRICLVLVLLWCCNFVVAEAVLDLRINRIASDDTGSVVDLVISNKTMKALSFDMAEVRAKFDTVNFNAEDNRGILKYGPLYEYDDGILEDDEPEMVILYSCGATNTIFASRDRIENVAVGDCVSWLISMTINCGTSVGTNKIQACGKGRIGVLGRKEFLECYPALPSCSLSVER